MTSEQPPKEYKILVSEISKGMEQLKQLRASSSGNQERVLDRMLTSYKEAWLILNGSTSEVQAQSEVSASWDPPGSSAAEDKYSRSSMERFTKVLDVQPGKLDVQLGDGYSWRKYGQKDILGSKHPRSYFRCTYRTEGCLATKQVQKLDNDVQIEVTYIRKHTCTIIQEDIRKLVLRE